MDSSRTHRSATETQTDWLGKLTTCLEILERSASLAVNITEMEEFISMLSSCSNGSLSQEMSVFSMWTDCTPILSEATAHLKRVRLMQQKMGTLWLEGLTSMDSELRYHNLVMSGLKSSWRWIEMSFLKHARVWLRGHFAAATHSFGAMPIGDIATIRSPTQHLVDYRLTQAELQSSLAGYRRLLADLELVSDLVRREEIARPLSPSARPPEGGFERVSFARVRSFIDRVWGCGVHAD